MSYEPLYITLKKRPFLARLYRHYQIYRNHFGRISSFRYALHMAWPERFGLSAKGRGTKNVYNPSPGNRAYPSYFINVDKKE